MRFIKVTLSSVLLGFLLGGCTTLQTVNKIDSKKLQNVCIVEHKAVRPEVLDTIKEILTVHGIKTQIVQGSYEIKGNQWTPTYQTKDVASCDAVFFYVANWTWDVAMYMHFATIWAVTADEKPVNIGSVRYEARASLNKWVNVHNKIAEMTNQLIGGQTGALTLQPTAANVAPAPAPTSAPAPAPQKAVADPKPVSSSATGRDDAAQLEKLKSLKDQGVITEDEFNKKKKEILDRM